MAREKKINQTFKEFRDSTKRSVKLKVQPKAIKFIQGDINKSNQIVLSQGQLMLQEMFNGEPTFGTGNNLPVINKTLTSGGGIIKNGDYERRTGRMFGLR